MLFTLRCQTAFSRCRNLAHTSLLFIFSAFLIVIMPAGVRADNSVVVLEFASQQCEACRQVEPLVQQLIANGYPIRQIDANNEPQLATQLGVKTLPTFVVTANGRVIDRIEGVFDGFVLERRMQLALDHVKESRNKPSVSQSSAQPTPLRQVSHVESQPTALQNARPAMTSLPVSSEIPWLQATVRLRVESPNGHDWGTGTIIDARGGEVLILTCGHIFRDSKGRGKIEVDLYCGNTPKRVPGVCLKYDADQLDLGLVKIAPPFDVDVIPVAPQNLTLQKGMTLISTGCDNGNNPTIRQHSVRSLTGVAPYVGAPFSYIQVDNAPVQGRSGGGLFTETGYLVGVCVAGNPNDNEGLFVPASVIQRELDLANLSCVYQSPSVSRSRTSPIMQASAVMPVDSITRLADDASQYVSSSPQGMKTSAQQIPTANPIPLAQPVYVPTNGGSNLTQPVFVADAASNANDLKSIASTQASGPENGLMTRQPGYTETALTDREMATLEEVQRRQSEGDEIIIIVRSKQKPNDLCEVIQLSNASSEFLNALTQQSAMR